VSGVFPLPAAAAVCAALAASVASLCVALAVLSRPGQTRWEPGMAGRLDRLGRPVWDGSGGGRGEPRRAGISGSPAAAGRPSAGVRRLAGYAAAAGAGAVAGLVIFGGVGAACASAAATVWALCARRAAARASARRLLQDGLEKALEVMVASLKAGQGLVGALEEAQRQVSGPLGVMLAGILDAYRAGTPLPEALGRLEGDRPLAEVSYLRACLETHLRTGGDITALLINLGGVIRERRRLGRDLVTRTSEARSTSVVLGLLPPGLLAYILWVEPAQLSPLLGSSFGLAASIYAGASWLAGVGVVRGMVDGVAREVEEET